MAIYIAAHSPCLLSPTPGESMINPAFIRKLFLDLYSLISGKLIVPPANDNLYTNSPIPTHVICNYSSQTSAFICVYFVPGGVVFPEEDLWLDSFSENHESSDFFPSINIRSSIRSLRAGGYREASPSGDKPPPGDAPHLRLRSILEGHESQVQKRITFHLFFAPWWFTNYLS
jgi:hypothetical protein